VLLPNKLLEHGKHYVYTVHQGKWGTWQPAAAALTHCPTECRDCVRQAINDPTVALRGMVCPAFCTWSKGSTMPHSYAAMQSALACLSCISSAATRVARCLWQNAVPWTSHMR
jgi:hypothetical protein